MLIQLLIIGSGLIIAAKKRSKTSQAKPNNLTRKDKISLSGVKALIKISIGDGDLHHQQLKQITSMDGDHRLDQSELKLNRSIKLSMSLMCFSLMTSWLYAPLLPLTGAAILIVFTPVFKKLFHHLKRGHVTTELIETISVLGLLASGHFFLAAFITFTSLLCQKLLIKTERHSRKELVNCFNQKQQTVWTIRDGAEVEVPLDAVQILDIVVVNAGEVILVDGTITKGIASIDQQHLTGESKPVEMEAGGRVFASTFVLAGRILIEVERTGFNTKTAKIGLILEQTQEYKERLHLRGKKIADGFITPTIVTSGLTLSLLGANSAMAVIWTAFGYNMKLYGPISVLNYLHIMAKNGLLIKDGRSLEILREVDTLVFDKTGTLTMEQPLLTNVYSVEPFDEKAVLSYAAAAEFRQTHPIAKAILTAAERRELKLPIIEEATYRVGYGIEVTIEAKAVLVGSSQFMKQQGILFPTQIQMIEPHCNAEGHSLIYVAIDGYMAGVLELQSCLRPEAKEIVEYLKEQSISVVIISGDHEHPTRRLAEELGIEHYFSETLPDKKAELIAELRANGKFVAYVGDGINDAIALKQANVSISLRAASTVAIDTAQIILMDGDLNKLKSLFEISKSFEANMRTNYLASMAPGVITLTGVFLFQMGLIGSLIIYFSSKIVGLTNTMLPLIKHEHSKRSSKND